VILGFSFSASGGDTRSKLIFQLFITVISKNYAIPAAVGIFSIGLMI
jgi:hypothetical protein